MQPLNPLERNILDQEPTNFWDGPGSQYLKLCNHVVPITAADLRCHSAVPAVLMWSPNLSRQRLTPMVPQPLHLDF